jgi:hypothetical protein
MLDLRPKPLVYNTSNPVIPKLAKPLTLQQAENLPEVKQALDRWEPASKDDYRIDSLGIRSKLTKDNPAINYLADPTKRGVGDVMSNVALFLIPELLVLVVELSCEKLSHPWAKNVLKTIQANKIVFWGLGLGLAAIQAFCSMGLVDKQKKTNQQALKAIATYGINAKYGDT